MANRYRFDYVQQIFETESGEQYSETERGEWVKCEDYHELEAENARLRQQRDAANAQLDFILENLKEEKAP